jgi:hypothetical protein
MRDEQTKRFSFAQVGWRIGLGSVAFLLFHLMSAFAAPSISANPNPVKVPGGRTQGTTSITWDTESSGGSVWLSIDGADETLVATDVLKGSIELSVNLGKTYELRLYSTGKERILASVKVTVIEQPSSTRGPLRNPQNQIIDDFKLKRTDQGYLLSQTPRELRCRGGADLNVQENPDHIIYFTFVRSALAVDPAGRNLSPGQCGWTDRPMTLDDREMLIQATDKTQGDVFRSNAQIPQSERFPSADEIRRVLKDQNRYWSFFVRTPQREYMFSEYSRQWIPIKPSRSRRGPRITRP